ncbi:MAG: phytanoyl-CoA dioxygenase [Planctomycetota bacterium]|nr:MAG: phytanoyl-CoA dioxygenase [Planctomycetota bacterium]
MENQALIAVESGRKAVSEKHIKDYQENGFVKVSNLISRECALNFREYSKNLAVDNVNGRDHEGRLNQIVNVWQIDDVMKELTLKEEFFSIAEQLSGVPLRIWHDHILSKAPKNELATEWHQDQAYWPHQNSKNSISVWIALQDTTVEMGCMGFIPKSNIFDQLRTQELDNSRSLYTIEPELEFMEKRIVPLKAGDATFHHGRTAHRGGPNLLDEWRMAHVVIYMDKCTEFNNGSHIITNQLIEDGIEVPVGKELNQTIFPCREVLKTLKDDLKKDFSGKKKWRSLYK